MNIRSVVELVAFAVCAIVLPSQAAKTCTWTGGGDDNNWSTPENWGGTDSSAVPAAGDTVLLSNGGSKPIINNDLEGLSLATVKFQGSNPLKLTGNGLSLSGSFSQEISAGVSTNAVSLTFTGDSTISFGGSIVFLRGVTNSLEKSMNIRCTTTDKDYAAYFEAPFHAPRCSLKFTDHKRKGYIHFRDEVSVKETYGDGGNHSAASGTVYFDSNKTTFGTARMNENAFICTTRNALDPQGVIWWYKYGQSGYTYVDLGGFDQTIDRTYSGDWDRASYRQFKSSSPARLTMNATASGTTESMFNDKVSVCFNPVESTTWFKVTNAVSTTTGDIVVSNGTFEVAGTASFKNVGTIEVADGASFVLSSTASLPLGEEKVVLRLAPTASVTLPASGSLRVASLYVGGVRQDGGSYTHATLPQLADNGASVGVKDFEREPVACTWDGGAGEDTSISADANWEGDVSPDLVNGTAAATFATAGESAEVGSVVSLYSMAFDGASTNFSLTGVGRIKLYGGSLSVAANHKSTVAVPVEIRKDHTLTMASGSTMEWASSIASVEGAGYRISKLGGSGGLVFNNAQVGCDFLIERGATTFSVAGGGETVFTGAFTLSGNETFKPKLSDSSTLVFENGFTWGANWIEVQNGSASNPGTWIFRNKPMKSGISATTGNLYPFFLAAYQTVRFEAQDNQCELVMKGTAPKVICGCDYAFSNYVTKVDCRNYANTQSVIDLNGFDQEFATLAISKRSDVNQSVEIRSGAPARLSIKQETDHVDENVAFIGQIDLEKRGAASLTFSRSYAATGTIEVVEGVLAFDANGAAPNVTNVTVTGGTFSLGRSGILPKTAVVNLSDDAAAVVNLGAGVRQRCGTLFVGGQKLEPGTYGSAMSGAQHAGDPVAAHFTGNGILSVGGGGLTLIFR